MCKGTQALFMGSECECMNVQFERLRRPAFTSCCRRALSPLDSWDAFLCNSLQPKCFQMAPVCPLHTAPLLLPATMQWETWRRRWILLLVSSLIWLCSPFPFICSVMAWMATSHYCHVWAHNIEWLVIWKASGYRLLPKEPPVATAELKFALWSPLWY